MKITCPFCSGTGEYPPGTICPRCDGSSEIVADWYVASDTRQESVGEKIDSIIAEQASQREDLTAALTQIWNKVKDL